MKKISRDLVRNNNFTLLIIFEVLFFTLISIRDFEYISISRNSFLLLFALFFILLNKENTVVFVAFMIPFMNGLPYNYIFIELIIIYLIKYFRSIKVKHIFLFAMVFLFYELAHFVYLPFSFIEFVSFAGYFILFIIVISVFSEEKDDIILVLMKTFIFSTLLVSVNLLFQSLQVYSFRYLLENAFRLGIILSENSESSYLTYLNPNSLALYIVVSLAFIVKATRFKKVWQFIVLAVFLLLGSLTLSRNFIITTFLLFFLWLISIKNIKHALSIFMFLIISLYLMNLLFPDLISNYLDRFKVEDISSGRIDIFVDYVNSISQEPIFLFFGVGIQSYGEKLGIDYSAHNVFLELLAVWGIFGVLLFTGMVYMIIAASKKISKYTYKLFNYIPFFVFVFSIQFSRLITTPSNFLLFAIVLVSIKYRKNSINKGLSIMHV